MENRLPINQTRTPLKRHTPDMTITLAVALIFMLQMAGGLTRFSITYTSSTTIRLLAVARGRGALCPCAQTLEWQFRNSTVQGLTATVVIAEGLCVARHTLVVMRLTSSSPTPCF